MSRTEQIERDLPDFLDLVTACVESGLGLDAAIQESCRRFNSPLADEFNEALRTIASGTPHRDAFMKTALRLNVSDLTTFVGHLVQAQTMGINLGNTLRAQAEDLRHKRFARAKEHANQLPVKLTFINVFFIPALMMELLGFFSAGKPQAMMLIGVAAFIFIPVFTTPASVKLRRALDAQLAETLLALASALRAGFSFVQTVDTVAQQTPAPLGDHLRKLAASLRGGTAVEHALDEFAHDRDSRDVRLMTTAVLVHQSVGSNLAEILTNLARTIRERVRMRGEIAALTASARFTGLTLTMLPLGLGTLVLTVRIVSIVMSPLQVFDNLFSFVGPNAGTLLVAIAFGLQWTATTVIKAMVGRVEAEVA